MSAFLLPAELSYLLHTLDAAHIIGVDNQLLFPESEAARDALLRQGLEALKENGWLVPEGNEWKLNTDLLLKAAALSDPEVVVTLAIFYPGKKARVFTYSLVEGLVVELFVTDSQKFSLARVGSMQALLERLIQILDVAVGSDPVVSASEVSLPDWAANFAGRDGTEKLDQAGKLSPIAIVTITGMDTPNESRESLLLSDDHQKTWIYQPNDNPDNAMILQVDAGGLMEILRANILEQRPDLDVASRPSSA